MEKIKVIYIVGVGHSGSTLLDRILETSDNALSVGEVMSLCKYEKLIKDKKIKFHEFWNKILIKVGSPPFFEHKSFRGKLKFFIGPLFNISFGEFDNFNFYSEILKQNQTKKTIIDSSKDINRLVSLKKDRNIDLYTIHLVRDVRGFSNSILKRKNESKRAFSFLSIFLKWFSYNLIVYFYLRLYCDKDKCLRVGYDHFVNNIKDNIKNLNKKLDLNVPLDNYINKANNVKSFAIVGNGMRNREIKNIKQDNSWKSELSVFKKTVLFILGFFPNRIWVYKKIICQK